MLKENGEMTSSLERLKVSLIPQAGIYSSIAVPHTPSPLTK